jgi:hypothetical protein
MMNPLVVVAVWALGGVASAAAIDDAAREVKRASEDGASCKGLPAKLRAATEAVEHARKAPVRGVIQQAKGRVELAKELASTACVDSVRARVTGELAAAISALEKAAEGEKVEKKGAAFGAACRTNDACASEHCYVGASEVGYCSRVCTAPSDCPAEWECRRLGSAPEKICTK